jgi:hypothetical protein
MSELQNDLKRQCAVIIIKVNQLLDSIENMPVPEPAGHDWAWAWAQPDGAKVKRLSTYKVWTRQGGLLRDDYGSRMIVHSDYLDATDWVLAE